MQVRRTVVMAVVFAGTAIAGLSMLNSAVSAGPDVEGTAWTLEELNGAALPALPEGLSRTPGIAFSEDGRFSATAGCNTMNGTAEISGTSISFPEQIATTMMACPPPLDELEQDMAAGLAAVAELRLEDGRMLFLDSAGAAVMAFSPAE